MTSFKEFLRSQEDRLRAEQATQLQAKMRWIVAVRSLLVRIKDWIKESDPHGLVAFDHKLVGDVDEVGHLRKIDGLEKLSVSVGDQQTLICPAVREVLGPRWKPGEGTWAGQVDLIGDSHGYELYWFLHADGRDEWYLRNTRDYQMKLLDRSSFDAALVDLFA